MKSRADLLIGVSRVGLVLVAGLALVGALMFLLHLSNAPAHADPIPPELGGYPKFNRSIKTVTPTLAHTGGVTLSYVIEVRNTGAFTAENTVVVDELPPGTTYNGDLEATVISNSLTITNGVITWIGDVGFDSSAIISFSVSVTDTLTGTVRNTAVISHPDITEPVSVTAETVITDQPIFAIEKSSLPAVPGANKPLTYTLTIANWGQPAVNLPITVTDRVPLSTTLSEIGGYGFTSAISDVVTWTLPITLDLGESTTFDFSVRVDDVPSGTVIANDDYQVASAATGVTTGEPYTVTIVDPIFLLRKTTWPDPPGSNREMTYTLSLLNIGSLATDLVITDRVPSGVDYRRGGMEANDVVSWTLPSLDTRESASFTFTVYISDVMDVPIVNDDYWVCSLGEDVCQAGEVLTSVVRGPTFEAFAYVYPIAKKPGGGGGPVTPTLMVRNLGPGNAISATAYIEFGRISVSNAKDLEAIPDKGTFYEAPDCGDKCNGYFWQGNLDYDEVITFTTIIDKNGSRGRSTIGGEEGTPYTATVVITDSMANMTTEPITATATGLVTHLANLLPTKSAPAVIGRGQLMTYTLQVWNSGLSTQEPPLPWLIDYVPTGTRVIDVSDDGVTQTLTDTVIVSWTLPALSTSERTYRTFTVQVEDDLVSGTQLVNKDYQVHWFEDDITGYTDTLTGVITYTYSGILTNTGPVVTTTVREVGLIDSYKEVTPVLSLPGPNTVLTYLLHIVNSGPYSLSGVTVNDLLPWESSTYLKDAVASAGEIVSDIINIHWTGDVEAFSSEIITLTVWVDDDFEGPITNTATISHSSLLEEVVVDAVGYVTEKPVLLISKRASPDPVGQGGMLTYQIDVVNLGQQATGVAITDAIPSNGTYVQDSATGGGVLEGEEMAWFIPELAPGERRTLSFQVTVGTGSEIINQFYQVSCAEGVIVYGDPVITEIDRIEVYLPLISRN